ncbi:N-acetylglucosamine-6-phosphate deacetylase [Paracoccus bogoriensis]|uniref:N-acetylglucosamine-6-phosphate deacetylase n=1 Tax=Paracoccus bogoriensis TaxID=242065 RepID=UPI001CA58658|nr:N-acetylglucosamine-6-phosphate deacetylase [Paracoccus bogoriensis]MBW7055465.1 N-acetylglucosamine-6-phosphate deacetylase [Paracoccus bogoriensis]
MRHILAASRLFDGTTLHDNAALVIEHDRIAAILPEAEAPAPTERVDGIIAPGFLDLQANGGGGLMVDGTTDVAALRAICQAHRGLGTAGILPTLITDTPDATARVIEAGIEAARQQVPGFLGLHLEGPHLDPRRKGAHDAALIRPMSDSDLNRLCQAARQLPSLMVTLAPEAAHRDQIAALRAAGAVVSLGHSDCTLDQAEQTFAAGATCATHLFNAMSQMDHRQPGLVSAVLSGEAHAGLIADGIHVHPAIIRVALRARPQGLFLVSDCMAFAGTGLTQMDLGGRRVQRQDGRLTLADGTLAGADLTLAQAVRRIAALPEAGLARALAMASSEPARALRRQADLGILRPGIRAELTLLDQDLTAARLWTAPDQRNQSRKVSSTSA